MRFYLKGVRLPYGIPSFPAVECLPSETPRDSPEREKDDFERYSLHCANDVEAGAARQPSLQNHPGPASSPVGPGERSFRGRARDAQRLPFGCLLHSNLKTYEVGMRLFVTLPFSEDPTAINREYLAEVARVEPLLTGDYGIGIKLLMEIALQQGPYSTLTYPHQ